MSLSKQEFEISFLYTRIWENTVTVHQSCIQVSKQVSKQERSESIQLDNYYHEVESL